MTKTILNVKGMSCGSCVSHVRHVLTLQGARDVTVDLSLGMVTIEHEPAVSIGELRSSLEEAGYPATVLRGAAQKTAPAHGCCGGASPRVTERSDTRGCACAVRD